MALYVVDPLPALKSHHARGRQLTLVFLGLVVSAHQSYAAGTGKKHLEPYRRAAVFVLVAFFIGLLCVGLATAWLVTDGLTRISGISPDSITEFPQF